jgi:hypothetical protein
VIGLVRDVSPMWELFLDTAETFDWAVHWPTLAPIGWQLRRMTARTAAPTSSSTSLQIRTNSVEATNRSSSTNTTTTKDAASRRRQGHNEQTDEIGEHTNLGTGVETDTASGT